MDGATNGAELLVGRLEAHGVATVFALPGEENLAVVEALGPSSIELVVCRHEQHAAFMAATHGRLTGRPGVCLATLGPGALNLLTGLAHAELGAMPVVAITGQKAARDNDEGPFQIIDVIAAARPVTRFATTIVDHRTIEPTVDDAFSRALAGRPGAVLIELPEDVAGEAGDRVASAPVPVSPVRLGAAAPADLAEVAAAVNRSERPVLAVGMGMNSPLMAEAVRHFAEATGIGVLSFQMGKGTMAESHPLALGPLGMHRPDYSHLALDGADLIITVGYAPVEHPPLAWNPGEDLEIVHLAPWPAHHVRGYRPSHQLVGNPAITLRELSDRIEMRDRTATIELGNRIQSLYGAEDEGASYPPSPLAVVRALQDVLDSGDIVALDNGAYKLWFTRHYRCEVPDTLLLDNALATMGAGLAAGTEAARLDPSRRTVAVCGDGGFLMNVQDLETAVRLGVDLVVVVVRDDAYGFIEWHQDEQGRPNDGVHVTNPDLVALAGAFGAAGVRVGEGDDLREVLRTALDQPGVTIVDCPLDYAINDVLEADLLAIAHAADNPV